jgi:eukaryotic-like serine/threonine-protein kinase
MNRTRSFLGRRGAPRDPSPPEPGRISIDGYRISRLVGAGPLTAVYEAVLESHQQHVALKVLLPHLAASEVLVQRFLQSANASRLISHDRVLPCYDVGQSNGWVYLACEQIEGATLAALQDAGPIERSRAIYLAWQVAMGLEAVHSAGLVHGNVRPCNVLIDDEDGVRLTDLGLPVPPDGEATQTAGAPELHRPPETPGDGTAADASRAGDIYALGVLLTGMLLGRTPWAGSSRERLAERHAARVPVLAELPPGRLDAELRAQIGANWYCRRSRSSRRCQISA